MLTLFKRSKGEEINHEEGEELKRQEEEKCERLRRREEARLAQLDTHARETLQGEYKDRYLLAKELGLERQAEIARIEGITNTTYIDLDEEEWLIERAVSCKLGYSVGGEHYEVPELELSRSAVTEFRGKVSYGAMLRYHELKDHFDDIRILHAGTDPTMYGVKMWRGEELYFRIMTWE